MSTYEVGLNDTPETIAHRLTGNRTRWPELIAANPQKGLAAIPSRGLGAPSSTFDRLYVGEKLNVPHSWRAQGQGIGAPQGLGATATLMPYVEPATATVNVGDTVVVNMDLYATAWTLPASGSVLKFNYSQIGPQGGRIDYYTAINAGSQLLKYVPLSAAGQPEPEGEWNYLVTVARASASAGGGGAVTTGGGTNYGASPRAPTGPQRTM